MSPLYKNLTYLSIVVAHGDILDIYRSKTILTYYFLPYGDTYEQPFFRLVKK